MPTLLSEEELKAIEAKLADVPVCAKKTNAPALLDHIRALQVEAERRFVNNVVAVLDADDVQAFTALVIKATKSPNLQLSTRSALASETDIESRVRADMIAKVKEMRDEWQRKADMETNGGFAYFYRGQEYAANDIIAALEEVEQPTKIAAG